MKKVTDDPDTQALAKFGTAAFAVMGVVGMLVFGAIAYLVTKNNAIRLAAVVIPLILALIPIIRIQMAEQKK